MKRSRFKITVAGSGVLPETTSVGDLADFLKNMEKAIVETAKAQGKNFSDDEAVVSLVDIQEGSNRLTLSIPIWALVAPKLISQALNTNDYTNVPTEALKALQKVSDQTVKKKWTVGFEKEPDLEIESAIISEECKVSPTNNKLKGTTTIFGRCVRVGGKTPKATIELYDGYTVYLDVSKQLAIELARSLYDEVGIDGIATWRTDNWKIVEFQAMRITDYHSTNPESAFKKLSEVSNGCLDGVDAEEFVQSLRYEENE